MQRFRVLHGMHCEGKTEDGKPRVYKRGEIVETETNLLKLNSPISRKFELVTEVGEAARQGFGVPPTPKPAVPSTLDAMTVEELRQLAEDEGIALGNAKKKEQIVEIINNAIASKEDED